MPYYETILFGDIEEALRAYLETIFPAHGRTPTVACSIPAVRPAELVVIYRVGGPKRDLVTDAPLITVECWAATGSAALSLAQLARAHINALPGQTISGLPVYRVQEASGPQLLPDPDSSMPRYVFTAQVDYRGTAA